MHRIRYQLEVGFAVEGQAHLFSLLESLGGTDARKLTTQGVNIHEGSSVTTSNTSTNTTSSALTLV